MYPFLSVLLSVGIIVQKVHSDTLSVASGNRIHFINTKGESGSDAIILESNSHYALIDMGEDYDFPDGSNPRYPSRVGISRNNEYVLEDRLFRHMKQVGIKKLDFILGTHVHSDHIGSADEVLKRFPVDRFYLKRYTAERITTKWRLWDNLYNYDNAVKTATERGVKLIQDISDKDSHFTLGDMDIQLYNYKNEYDSNGNLKRVFDDNSNSIVAVVTVAGKRIYLGGDLDNAEGAEDKLGPVIGKVDMMKWNHHYDAKISNTIPFLDYLSPKMVVHTSAADANLSTTRDYLKRKNIQVVHASSQTKDATVFTIGEKGFTDISESLPNIPTVNEKWYKEDGYWKYRLSDDEMTIGWRKIDGVYYFFNGQGQMQASKWLHLNDSREKLDGNWYYLNSSGKMQESGWFKKDGFWYYITATGARKYNELVEISGQKYLFDKDGKMLTGLHDFNGKKMFFATNGALQSNGKSSSWKKASGNWYYYDENGIPSLGKKNINGSTYYFNQEGVMQTGWTFVNGQWNYYASSGVMQTGWIKDKDIWYYLNKDGIMLTGNQEINGIRYYLNTSGTMQTGWKWFDNHYSYFTSSGAMKTGWLKDNGLWYYLDKEGIMQTGLQEIEGTRYYLNASGAMQTGWRWLNNHYYYFATSGAMKTGWFQDKGVKYYLDVETGQMATGLYKVNDESYYFDANGAMQTGWKQLNGNWYYFQADGSLLKNTTTPDGYKVNEEGVWKQVVTVDKKTNHSTNKQETSTLTDKSDKINKAEKQEKQKEMNSSNSEKQKEDSIIESSSSDKKEKE